MTLFHDKDYEKILKIKKQLEDDLVPFELEVNSVGLFSIYPATLVKEIKQSLSKFDKLYY